MCNDIKILKDIIRDQRSLSKSLQLPFSAIKTQLIVIYPKSWSFEKHKPGRKILGIKIKKQLKILGLIWEQPRFDKRNPERPYWFHSQAKKTLTTLRHIARKSKRLKFYQNSLD